MNLNTLNKKLWVITAVGIGLLSNSKQGNQTASLDSKAQSALSDQPLTFGDGQELSPVESSVSYGLIRLRNGEALSDILPLSGDDAQLADDVIMNCMVKSAAWPGVDIKTLEECFLLRATYSDSTSIDYYAYMLDGKAVLQRGSDGMYSLINNEMYEKLVKVVQSSLKNM